MHYAGLVKYIIYIYRSIKLNYNVWKSIILLQHPEKFRRIGLREKLKNKIQLCKSRPIGTNTISTSGEILFNICIINFFQGNVRGGELSGCVSLREAWGNRNKTEQRHWGLWIAVDSVAYNICKVFKSTQL